MKRVVFLLKRIPDFSKRMGLILRMMIHGVTVSYEELHTIENLDDDTLYITDDKGSFDSVKALGAMALVYIHTEAEMDEYEGAKFFVMDAENTEYDYFDKIYRRIHNLPWEMVDTYRLILRETTESDIDAFYEMYKDPRMTEYMEPLYQDREEELKYIKEYREKVYETQGFGIWTVVRKRDNKVIGRAGLTAREGFDELEVGFAIGCEYQREGYGSEAVRGVLSFARDNKLGKINALVMPGNTASKGLLKKEGFKKISETRISSVLYEVWQSSRVALVNLPVL